MKTVAIVYTSMGQYEKIKALYAELAPELKLYHIIEDSMVGDLTDAGCASEAIVDRLRNYFKAGVRTGADVIMMMCSSVGGAAMQLQGEIPIPIIRVDSAMMSEALKHGTKIGMIGSLKTTLVPSTEHAYEIAKKEGKTITVIESLAEGAHPALVAKNFDKHDELVMKSAKELVAKGVDVIVLAQASLSRMEESIAKETGKPCVSSPRLGVLSVKKFLEKA